MVTENRPSTMVRGEGRGEQGDNPPILFLKSYFARNFFLEICFFVILQGTQNFFVPGTPRIFSGVLEKDQIYGVKITGRYICEPKQLNLFIFAHFPKQNYPPVTRKLSISPEQHFLKIYFSTS